MGERVEWLLIKDIKYVLQSSKYPLNRKVRVSDIEQFCDSLRIVPRWEIIKMIFGFSEGKKNPMCSQKF